MKNILLLLSLTCCFHPVSGQSLKKYVIGKSGCSALFYCDPKFESTLSPDSLILYSGECAVSDITYGLICVRLKVKAPDLDKAEGVLEQYLDYLKGAYEVASAAGYKKGFRLKKKENTRGILDSWVDKDNNNIKIKGWTSGRYIVVLLAISPKELPDAKVNPFLDGIVFPVIAKTSPPKHTKPHQ